MSPDTLAPRLHPPATQSAVRMLLPWAANGTSAEAAKLMQGQAGTKPQLQSAALPWGRQEHRVTDAPRPATPSLSTTLVADTAAELKFSPALTNWLGMWEQIARVNDPTASIDVSRLEQLLAAETATVSQLLSLMRSTQALDDHPEDSHTAPYPLVSGAIACRAIFVGMEQAGSDTNNRYTLMNQISPLIRRLWFGSPRHAKAVQQFYEFLAHNEPTGSSDWHRGHVGSAEALIKQGLCKEALQRLTEVEAKMPQVTPRQLGAIEYAKGIALYDMGQYSDAATSLAIAARTLDRDQQADAAAFLVMALSYSGKIADAQIAYDQLASGKLHSRLSTQAFYIMKAEFRAKRRQQPQSN